MSGAFSVKILEWHKNTLIINTEKSRELGIRLKKLAHISFGNKRQWINLIFRKDISPNEVFISQDIIDYLLMPQFIDYEIRILNNEIVFGPFIGILINRKDSNINAKRLKLFLDYVNSYSLLNGAILVFALDKINHEEKTIEGYLYNDRVKAWIRGSYPMPCSIYRKISLSDSEKNYLLSCIGDRIFNSYYFDKYEAYNWLKVNKEIVHNVPYTDEYKSFVRIFRLMDKYGSVYLKPTAGRQGKGVIKVIKKEDKLYLMYREKGKNICEVLDEKSDIDKYLKKENYIIQQGIDVIRYQNRVVDFRVIMQKDITGEWQCTGIIARIGKEESVVSNVSSGGIAKDIDIFLKKYLKLYEIEIYMLKEKIVNFSTKVCKYLDEIGLNLGNLGLDIALDKKEKLWLIEINNKCPAPSIALDSDNRILYYRALTNPMFYAKYLAGFGEV